MRIRPKSFLDLESVRQALMEMLAAGTTAEASELVIGLLSRLRDSNTQLELERMRLLRRHVGKTSERVSEEQLRLLFESVAAAGESSAGEAAESTEPADAAALTPPEAKLPEDKPKAKGHGRRPLPEHLPRVVVPRVSPRRNAPVRRAERSDKALGTTRARCSNSLRRASVWKCISARSSPAVLARRVSLQLQPRQR